MSVSLKSVREITLVGVLVAAAIALPAAAVSAPSSSGVATSSYLAGPIKLS